MFKLNATFNETAIHDLVDQSLVQIGRGVARVLADEVHVFTGRTRRTVRSSKKVYTSGTKREVIVRSGGMVVAGKDTSDYVGVEYARHPEQYQDAISYSAALINSGDILNYERVSGDELYLERDNWRRR